MAIDAAQSPPDLPADEFLAATIAELTDHCAGNPNAAEKLLIERAAALALRLRRMEAAAFAGNLTKADEDRYEVLLNRLCRILGMLGLVGGLNHAKDLHGRIALKGEHRAERSNAARSPMAPPVRAAPINPLHSPADDAIVEQMRALARGGGG